MKNDFDKTDYLGSCIANEVYPVDPSAVILTARGLSSAIEEFINDRFPGLCRVNNSVDFDLSVAVSPDYLAFYFKKLLAAFYGRAFLEINILCEDNSLAIVAKGDISLSIYEKEMRDLIRIARNAGMEIYFDSGAIRTVIALSEDSMRHIYAISLNESHRVMLKKLCEMFCGIDPCISETGQV